MSSNRLAALRKTQDLTQAALARECGVTTATLWRWEHGKVSIPDKQKLALAERFGVSVGALMGWEPMPAETAA